ncbi:MAG TPA: YidC/Oxa1 family membrane protein insertase [Planctomycetota bacterium]
MLGLLALALGGGAFVRRRNSVGGAAPRPTSRWPFLVAVGLFLSVSCGWLLYHLHCQDLQNQRLRTNLVRKSTEGKKAVGDTSLKTLSFSGQTKHERGLSTDALQAAIDQGRALNLIDVREPEEVEMGAIEGTWARRYPDLQVDHSGLVVEGKQTVLLCESGNRSSELCDWFFDRGITTQFVVGGYEKWVAEDRPMAGRRQDGTDIRALPWYPQKEILLDTPEVMDLFTTQGAVFVDVRYPEEFEREHLPGAINLTLRKMLKDEAEAALKGLPKRPIIAVCYDKRSSFYGLLLGLRLHRIGADFRGRYTVPQEFTMPVADSPWVADWKKDREGQSLFGLVGASVGTLVAWLAEHTGLLLAILLLVILLRAAMLPFSLFAERDQWAQRGLAPQFAKLREQWANDPEVWRREAMRRLRRAGVSPLRNLVGALVQIGLFAAAFAGVDSVAASLPTPVLWFDLSAADPVHVLPVLFGVVMAMFVRLQQQNKRRWVLPLVFVAVMVALVWESRAAVQLYLIASLGLMALQTVLQRRWLGRGKRVAPARSAPTRLVPLELAGDYADLGNKAMRLGRLLEAGLPVPPGFVVPAPLACSANALTEACATAGISRAAVRSSAVGEDGAASSMAGMFRTELDVATPHLSAAVERVRESYGGRVGGVVVQEFRQAEWSGVLFTVDPAHAGRMLVELVKGGCDALVSGRATPKSFRFGRATNEQLGGEEPPLPLAELIELGRRVEALFGCPQDIEWVCSGGRFQLVQARDITRLPQNGPCAEVEAERHRLLEHFAGAPPAETVLEQTEIAELLPAPTGYSLALFQSLWEAGGAVDRACRSHGFPYDVGVDDQPLVQQAFGRCFVDLRQKHLRNKRSLSALASFRMAASAQTLEDDWRAQQPARLRRVTQLAAIDASRLPEADLLQLCEEVRATFVEQTYAQTEAINMAAGFFVDAARHRAARAGLDAAALLRDPVGNVVSRALLLLSGRGPAHSGTQAFLEGFGHRAVHDFELSEPRYGEDPQSVAKLLPRGNPRGVASVVGVDSLSKLLRTAVLRARRFQALKEEAKHEAMREVALLRSLLCHVGQRFQLGDGVFELTPAEVQRLTEPEFRSAAPALTAQRSAQRQKLLAVDVPTSLSAAILETLGEDAVAATQEPGDLKGTCVAGSREVTGRVRVLRAPEQLGELQPGEILVARCTDPCWMSAFTLGAGLVTEIGGWLSHAAIQAREHDLATVVGVVGATRRLRTGDIVKLKRSGAIELIAERRRPRPHVELLGELRFGGLRHPVRVRDLGPGGACIEIKDPRLLPDGSFEMRFGGEVHQASLAWRNCKRAGVKFDTQRVSPPAAVSEIRDTLRGTLRVRLPSGR